MLDSVIAVHNGLKSCQLLNVLEKFIFQKEFNVSYYRNGAQETKIYAINDEAEVLRSAHRIFKSVAIILNPVLLRPFDLTMQTRAFNILRRTLLSFPQYIEYLRNPISLVLTNLAVYAVHLPPTTVINTFIHRASLRK